MGVKSHKKSNAVGDPDGEGSDNDSDSESDWEEFEPELKSIPAIQMLGNVDPTTQVQLEFELVEENDDGEGGAAAAAAAAVEDDDDEEESTASAEKRASSSGGGVGLLKSRLGVRRRNGTRKELQPKLSSLNQLGQPQLCDAWKPFLYLPPSQSALNYLKEHSRLLDGASKSRLDRRTLYACLLMEWLNVSASYRKFLEASSSQALQAALSMATQPQWRRAFPRHNGIRLYDADEPNRGCTLAMQESIAMALVR